MDPAQLLRQRERRLVREYGAGHPHRAFGGEDLGSEDLEDVEHWVAVYTELVQFMQNLIDSASQAAAGPPAEGDDPLRGMTIQTRCLELHLNFWSDKLSRLRASSASGPDGGS